MSYKDGKLLREETEDKEEQEGDEDSDEDEEDEEEEEEKDEDNQEEEGESGNFQINRLLDTTNLHNVFNGIIWLHSHL